MSTRSKERILKKEKREVRTELFFTFFFAFYEFYLSDLIVILSPFQILSCSTLYIYVTFRAYVDIICCPKFWP